MRTRKANARVAELEAEKAIPKDKPLAPLREDYDEGSQYQEAMDKYQGDIVTYNKALSSVETEQVDAEALIKVNDDRLIVQMEDLICMM